MMTVDLTARRAHSRRQSLQARNRRPANVSEEPWYRSFTNLGMQTAIGIEILELSNDRVVATMPVDDRTRQPFGILHGGASIALAETVASIGATGRIDRERFIAVGQEINGN